jgi:drug/metabolite transporter (DMT)-like permease
VLGAVLALLSAATFGLNNATLRRGVLSGSVLQALAITVPIGAPLFLLVCLIFGALGALSDFSRVTWIWMSVAGVIHFVIGRYGNYRSTEALGGALSAPIGQISVLVALALGVGLLGEQLTPLRVLGIVLVMFSPILVVRRRRNSRPVEKTAFQPRYLEGTLWGVVGALGYGVSPAIVRMALQGGGVTEGIAAGFISYLAAAILVGLLLIIPANRTDVMGLRAGPARWFAFSGFAVFVSQVFRYMALAIAPVSVVTTIQRTSVVFRVIFAHMLNREHEILDARTYIGIFVSMLGVVALTVSTEFVLAHMPLPQAIAALARLTWP